MKRIWEPPKARHPATAPPARHRCKDFKTHTWHAITTSRQEGREVLGYLVVQTRELAFCRVCWKGQPLKVTQVEDITYKDALHYYGTADQIPGYTSRELKSNNRAGVNAHPPKPAIDPLEAAERAEVEANLFKDPASFVSGPTPPAANFWKKIPSWAAVLRWKEKCKNDARTPFPWTSPAAVIRQVMEETHVITEEHTIEHLALALATASAVATHSPEQLMYFAKLILNIGPAVACRAQDDLVRNWGLIVLDTGESWMPLESSIWKFVTHWLGVPYDSFYPTALQHMTPPQKEWSEIHKVGVDPEPLRVGRLEAEAIRRDNHMEERPYRAVSVKGTPAAEEFRAPHLASVPDPEPEPEPEQGCSGTSFRLNELVGDGITIDLKVKDGALCLTVYSLKQRR